MTLLWITLFPLLLTAAWLRYCAIAAGSAEPLPPKTVLSQPAPRDPWGSHHHQMGARWLHDIFERSAARFPDLTALTVPESGESLSYAELDARANHFAGHLRHHLSGSNQVVAVHLRQDSADIVALHLAILKAGATQVFIDPDSPSHLYQQILADAAPTVLITETQLASLTDAPFGVTGMTIRSLESLKIADSRDISSQDRSSPQAGSSSHPSACQDSPSQRIASLFYTSGTTGTPKGVECAHAGYINLVQSYATYYDFVPGSDASSLTSSLGYDGSISELYSAWVAGCEVVLLTKAALRSGPELLPILREHSVTALFCPPVLLSTLTANPEVDLPYPICRYIVPAGEAFPASLVEPWSRARRQIVNTYGPTEVSTDTSRQLLRPNEPVTIGSPFAGVSYFILDPATLELLPHGTEGELCIGGCQLAQGYRNRPEATAKQFFTHPQFGRLYRSGDRCHVDPITLRVHFHGRLDAQLKVRGFRVEAQPIESLLQDHFAEFETAVLDCQNSELIAFIRAPSLWHQTQAYANVQLLEQPLLAEAQALVGQKFPPYAVPSRVFLIDQFDLLAASGKIDRRGLPQVTALASTPNQRPVLSPQHDDAVDESLDVGVLALCRAQLGSELGWRDDFVQWGAHSIAIAQLTQTLQAAGYPVTVRALLSEYRCAADIAALTCTMQPEAEPASHQPSLPTLDDTEVESRVYSFRSFSALQASASVLLRVPLVLVAGLGLAIIDPEILLLAGDVLGFLSATIISYCLYMIVPFVNLSWVVLLRLIQRGMAVEATLEPGRYQKYSSHHLQVWWMEQQAGFVLRPLVNGLRSPNLFNWALRRLGAHIHPGTFIAQSTEWYGPLSLMTIEEGAVIQAGAQISTIEWESSVFTLKPIHIGPRARVGSRAMVSAGGTLGEGSWLTPLSSLQNACDAYSQVSGVPGAVVGTFHQVKTPHQPQRSGLIMAAIDVRNVLLQLALELSLVVIPGAFIALIASFFLGLDALNTLNVDDAALTLGGILKIGGAGIAGIWIGVLSSSLLLCLFLRLTPTPPGWMSAFSLTGTLARYRQTKMNQIQQMWGWSLTGQYLRALAGVKFSRVGASECDALVNVLPEQLDADANIFIAQGCYCNVLDEHGAFLLVKPLRLPAGFFASNNAMIEPGAMPGNLLLGVSTPIGPHDYREQYTDRPDLPRVLAGNPPLSLGATSQPAQPVHPRPSWWVFMMRFVLNDFASVGVVPGITVFLATTLLVSLNALGLSNIGAALVTSILFPISLPLLALLIKYLLVGNSWGAKSTAPFWSVRHFAYFLAQDCFFRLMSSFMSTIAGTALANPLLRRFGCRIGQRSLIGLPIQLSDWHAVDIGDDCVVNGQMQLHSFENRILNVARTKIGNNTVINHGSMLMGGATLADNVTVSPQSLILKAMQLPPGLHTGSPTQPVNPAPLTH